MVRGKVDYKRAKKAGVNSVLVATEKRGSGNRLFIVLTLRDTAQKVALQREFPAPDGRMLDEDVGSARDAILLELLPTGPVASSAVGPIDEGPKRVVGAAVQLEGELADQVPPPKLSPRELLPEEEAERREQQRRDLYADSELPAASEPEEPEEDETARPDRVLLDYGIDMFGRTFKWVELSRGDLLPYEAGFIIAPRFGASVQPLLLLPTPIRLPVKLSVEGSYRFALGLMTRAEGSALGRPTGLTRFDLGTAVGWSPHGASQYLLSGLLGYRGGHFDVAPSASGARLESVPKLALRELRLGGRLEYSFEGGARLQGEVAFLPLLSASDVISKDYFLGGGGAGFEASLGGWIPAHRIVDVGGLLNLTRVSLSLTNGADRDHQAKGAIEQHVGGSFVVRVRL